MTFYDLIRNSLLMDSKKYMPPGILMQTVLDALRKKELHAADVEQTSSDRSKDFERSEPE